jgi:lantibiotic modifying enzyme
VSSAVTDVEAVEVPKALGADWWAGGLTLAERRALSGAPTPAPGIVAPEVIGGSAGGLVAMLSIHRATGLAGALDAARACADRLVETPRPQDVSVAWAAHALASFEDEGPLCGTPGGISTPGLMAGRAGIGHGLLRDGFPDRVPSVPLLQSPMPWR